MEEVPNPTVSHTDFPGSHYIFTICFVGAVNTRKFDISALSYTHDYSK